MANASRIIAIALFGIAGLLGLYAFTLTRAAPLPAGAHTAAVAQAAAPAVAVIVAARDLTPGRALSAEDLTIAPQAVMPAGGFDSASVLIGRLPAAHVPAGAAITEGLLGTGLSAAIEPGERAVSIRVDENNAVSNLVKPGDTVDVFLVLKRDAIDGEIPASHARLLLSKVRVLGFGDSVIAEASNAPKAPGQTSAARTAVLAVRVEDIDALTLAENSGRLMLALRNPVDGGSASLTASKRAEAGVSLAALTGGMPRSVASNAATPMLPPLPANLNTSNAPRKLASNNGVEVIRGSRSESVSNP
jgi:pilus assembly protein CpaB